MPYRQLDWVAGPESGIARLCGEFLPIRRRLAFERAYPERIPLAVTTLSLPLRLKIVWRKTCAIRTIRVEALFQTMDAKTNSMTASLLPTDWLGGRARGFTLVEIMIGVGLSAFILAGVLTTFLFLGRSGANVQNYNDMETQARRCLEVFAVDARQASAITWNSATSVTLVVNSTPITYAYTGSTPRTFTRQDVSGTHTLLTGIVIFSFKAYTITGTEITDFSTAAALATAGNSTKQLQLSLATSRSNSTVVEATNTVLSARFILRNKIVSS
jgi:type II secretory pathway pseudopilin PulG